jgi:anti-anti-sigma factor
MASEGGFIMTCNYAVETETAMMTPGNIHELVRGQEQRLLAEIGPVVSQQTVTLDMAHVDRIDAAGIAALITLYGNAHMAGHEFSVTNPSHRVKEILSLVGLDRILLSHDAAPCPQSDPCFQRSAA